MNIPQLESHILIVDDDSFALKVHAHMVESMGWKNLVCFESASEALDFIDSKPESSDLVLLDVNMPKMDGIEFVRRLVERNFTGAIVLISGESGRLVQSIVALGREHGLTIIGQLEKPAGKKGLQEILALWVEEVNAPTRSSATHKYNADDLRKAIACGELVNFYQPQVALTDGEFLGVETLVRWLHPEDGVVEPISFIGLAEDSGQIDDVARCVLAGLLADAQQWDAAALRPVMSLNLSARNLGDPSMAEYIFSACQASNLNPARMVIEVTESCLMHNRLAALEILSRLRLRRFGLSIDDFGTGYSSFSQLQDISFSELKIDYRFAHGAAKDPTKRAIFEASLDLALNMNMRTVAEGVENEEDWDFVRSTRCDMAQGFFVARPMPADSLPEWLAHWKIRCKPLCEKSKD
jgi:EAL domain-containing protein (putative c-di-GMP-specific phosphodiesterase class I)/CheY-like chemotaxis protein